jgi:hypothetical protein
VIVPIKRSRYKGYSANNLLDVSLSPRMDAGASLWQFLEFLMPDFRVIEGGGKRRNAKQDVAEQHFANHLREAVANALRVVRGAGRPADLIKQFHEVVVAAIDIREITGQGPAAQALVGILAVEDEADEIFKKHASGQIRQESIDRWDEDGTFDRMYAEGSVQRGALQIIASKLLDQSIQVRAGQSEMQEGIRRVIAVRERQRAAINKEASVKTNRKKRGRKTVLRSPKSSTRDV